MPNWLESMEQTFEYYTVNPSTLGDIKRLDNVKGSSFVRDKSSETLGSATVDIGDSIGESYIRCYLKTIQKGITEKHPLGTVLAQTPLSSFDGKILNVSMDCYTPLLELKEKKPPLGYTVRKGSRIMDEAYRIVRENARVPVSKVEPNIKKSKNLYRGGDISGTLNTAITIEPISAGTYTVSADVNSSDTDSNDRLIIFYNDRDEVTRTTLYDGDRSNKTVTFTHSVNKIIFYASDSWVNSQEDPFSFKNIQIELGSEATEYEPYFEPIDLSPTLQYDFVANTDDTWLTFINALISYAKYELDLSETGHILFSPKQDMASLQPVWTYNDDNSSILYPELTMDHDLYGIHNVVEVIYSYGGDYKRAVAKNEDVNSPTSIQSRGREIPYRDTNPNLSGYVTDEQLQAYAEQLLRELSTIEYTVSYTHAYCPVRPGDCVRLNYTRAGLNNVKAKVISQNIKCEPGCPVSEKAVFTAKLWR